MRRLLATSVVALLGVLLAIPASAQCVKIKDGTLVAGNGAPLTLGFDQWGYNYQAHMFNGLVENYSRPADPVTEGTENLVMKWSDDWLANVDCNQDGKLDRGLDPKTGLSTGTSLGWTTNHFEGDYLGNDGEYHHYTYFVKIVYVGPAPTPDPWGGDVSVGGKRIWGVYAIVEELQNDEYGQYGGRLKFVSKLVPPGLGLD